VRPLDVAARLLVGGRPLPEVVDVGQRRDLDLAVLVPEDELGAVCTNEQWAELYDRVAALAREHKSTLVFVNTRRLVERVTCTWPSAWARTRSPRTTAACRGSAATARNGG
jgi:ATP-dependent Lhr-like helicase